MTRLDELLKSIDPDMVITPISNSIDRAINTFRCSSRIEHWDEFRLCMSNFLCHVVALVMHLRQPMDSYLDHYWDQGIRLMHKAYGPNGEKAAFEIARTGKEGGIRAVLKAVATHYAEQCIMNQISARINAYWQSLSVQEQLQAPVEYVNKHGHLLPSELTESSAVRVAANFPKVLTKHPQLLKNLRRTGR